MAINRGGAAAQIGAARSTATEPQAKYFCNTERLLELGNILPRAE